MAARRAFLSACRAALLGPPACEPAAQLWPGAARGLGGRLRSCVRGVKRQANEVRPGNIIESDGRLCEVVKFSHAHGHGRQLGNVQMELRDLARGSKAAGRWRPDDAVEVVRLESRPFQYLYSEDGRLLVMDPVTYEQRSVPRALLGERAAWLVEGATLQLSLHGDDVLAGQLPPTVTLEVVDASPPGDKGGSVSASYKRCTLSNGAQVMVPPSIAEGHSIVVDTRDGSFLRRAGVGD